MTLKTNLHFHAKHDEKISSYDIYRYIDYAKSRGFDVLAYTAHRKFLFKQEYANYAHDRGILLIPGIEMEIKKKHIVVLNCDGEIDKIKSFEELRDYKRKNPQILILAPHPFVLSPKSLFSNLLKNIDLFDAIEMTIFSNKIFNFNKKAAEIALKYGKPFVATSDTHFLKDLERGYALIDAETKTVEDIFTTIRKKRFQNKMTLMSPLAMAKHRLKAVLNYIFNYFLTSY